MGRTVERGYGGAHQELRRCWAPAVAAGIVDCARCGERIIPGTAWDLGHRDDDRRLYSGPEHARCNRASAARRRNRGYRRLTVEQAAIAWAARERAYWERVIAEQMGRTLAGTLKLLQVYGHGDIGALEEIDRAFNNNVTPLRAVSGGGAR